MSLHVSTSAPPDIAAYLALPSSTTPAWFADGRLAYLSDASGVPQVWVTDGDGGAPRRLTGFPERIGSLRASPRGDRLVFGMDAGANEHEQLWLLAPGEPPRPLTSNPDAIHQLGPFDPEGRRIAFASNARDRRYFDVSILHLDDPAATPQPVLALDALLSPLAWSPDGTRLLVERANSNLDHDLLLVDLAGGDPQVLTPHDGEATIAAAAFSRDGDALYLVSNQDREFAALLRLDLVGRALSVIAAPAWDLEALARAPGSDLLAYAINEDGASRVVLLDPATGEERQVSGLPSGVVSGLAWSPDGRHLAFGLARPTQPSEVWTCDTSGAARPVVTTAFDGLDPAALVEPEVIRYETFDGRQVPAYWFRPAGQGPWPVVVDVHGGPESQRRHEFLPVLQYLVGRGFAVLSPNVRGSTGYGKTYSHLDDIEKRMDAVADLASAVAWLRARPDVVPDRIAVHGRSYGGFMVLAAVTAYPDLWAAGVDIVGIADFVTFLERTGPWRRRTRAAEYGDPERDAEVLRAISPIHKADRITAPMLVIHGRNDPRVPVHEAEQIASRLESLGRDVELLIFDDEGHQITKLPNKITAYSAVARFLERTLR